MSKIVAEKGQSLIELIVTIAIAATLLTTLTFGIISAREAFARGDKRLDAELLLQKEIEAIRNIKESNWQSITTPGTYHVEQSGNRWIAVAGSTTTGDFTRGFTVSNVCRLSPTAIPTSCTSPGATIDPSTKQLQVSVSWSFLGTQAISSTFYLNRFFGNQTWTQTSKSEFDQGTFDNTESHPRQGGEVRLSSNSGGSSFTAEYDNAGDYTFDPSKIEIAGSNAQLKAQGSSFSGSTTNSGFDSSASGWTFNTWGQNIGQTGSYRSTGGNPGGYIDINMPRDRQVQAGGYWYQAFTTNGDNPTATLNLDWRIFAFDSHPSISYHLYAFVDTNSSAPIASQNVWDSGEISGTTSWSAPVTVDVSSKVQTAGTYYLKVAVFVTYGGPSKGPFRAGFDNVTLSWSGSTGSYPTDEPTIYKTVSFTAPSINSWDSFSETATTNGGSIRYQLSDDDGATWQYFNGSAWTTATSATDYNDATTMDNNINSFSTTNNKINVRSFLISDGSQLVQLDRIEIGYTGSNTGTFISSTFDAGGVASFNRIIWTATNTANTTTQFQIATNTDNSTWNFVGPDGTTGTYYTGGGGIISLNTVSGRYLRYKILFTSTNNDLPTVEDVTINYSP